MNNYEINSNDNSVVDDVINDSRMLASSEHTLFRDLEDAIKTTSIITSRTSNPTCGIDENADRIEPGIGLLEKNSSDKQVSLKPFAVSSSLDRRGCHTSAKMRHAALANFRKMLDKYLECSSLLNPHLDSLVTTHLVPVAIEMIQLKFSNTMKSDMVDFEGNFNDVETSVKRKPSAEEMEREDTETLDCTLSALYALCKVCGRKKIQKLLAHEAAHVEPVLHALKQSGARNLPVKPDDSDPRELLEFDETPHLWESSFVLLLWMDMLSYVPFDLSTIDSLCSTSSQPVLNSAPSAATSSDVLRSTTVTLVQSIISTATFHLSDSGPTREAASACLASYLRRPDLERVELHNFVDFARKEILCGARLPHQIAPYDPIAVFRIMGVIHTLAIIFKSSSSTRSEMLKCVEQLWEPLILLSDEEFTAVNGSTFSVRKLLVKLFARVGCSYLPPRVAEWRYQRGKRVLMGDLIGDSNQGAKNCSSGEPHSRSPSNTLPSGKSVELPKDNAVNTEQQGGVNSSGSFEKRTISDAMLVTSIDQLEDVMDQLLHGLKDSATVVRWSAAKGVGRVTERLPVLCADDVVDAVLNLSSGTEKDGSWHGACLALAELARRGLLLPEKLHQVVPTVVKAIQVSLMTFILPILADHFISFLLLKVSSSLVVQFDVRRGQHSVGAHVRDAACYTCWAFARAYAPSVLKPFAVELGRAMVLASLFDREVNCRRAASAAFQEFVGRQGAQVSTAK